MWCLGLCLQIISIIVVLISQENIQIAVCGPIIFEEFRRFIKRVECKGDLICDSLRHPPYHEGNLGQDGVMPWLGVIRAFMHGEGMKVQIAVTGAVLVKPKHAIANAHDMTKIRKKGNCKAMFISSDRGIWTCKVSEVAIHPEYEFATYNTIALVELDTESISNSAPMLPICMPAYMYNTSNQLYAAGFTDENKLLEKVAYKVQYVERALCDEFYLRAGHGTGLYTPQLYQCAFAENNLGNCEWENGMALTSNVSGYWVLVGFGVQGPGCSAPARFIDIYPYFRWIESASKVDDFDADYPFKVKVRRSDSIESEEQLEDLVITRNYLKRDRIKFNMTFREFLKEYKFKNKTTNVHEETSSKNDTSKTFLSKFDNVTRHFKQDKTRSDEFESEDRTKNNTFVSDNSTADHTIRLKTDKPNFENQLSNAENLANRTISI